jgi:16S rRNA (guanine966-N2)-methyltransferase
MIRIIGGLYRGQQLQIPKGNQTRPTSNRTRETFFNICQQHIKDGNFLDVFAGSGAMGLEAISRGAHSATFIDQSRDAITCIQKNIAFLKIEQQCYLLPGDVFKQLSRLEKQQKTFTMIYVDPPYQSISPTQPDMLYSSHLIKWIDCHPILSAGGFLFVEDTMTNAIELNSLEKISERSIGSTILQQYRRK